MVDPSLDGYAVPGKYPDPIPPLIWGERFGPVVYLKGFDDSDGPLEWRVVPIGPPWPEEDMKQMWLQLMQILRLPQR